MKKNKLETLIKQALDNLSELVDVNAVIGKPIDAADGTKIIPISKVTLGYLTGGGEYGEKGKYNLYADYPFTGASGAVVSLKPSAFLVNKGNDFKIIQAPGDIYDKIMEKAEDFIAAYKNNK